MTAKVTTIIPTKAMKTTISSLQQRQVAQEPVTLTGSFLSFNNQAKKIKNLSLSVHTIFTAPLYTEQ
jgi:hypothetical protein